MYYQIGILYLGRVAFPGAKLLIIFNLLALFMFFYQLKKGIPDSSKFKRSFYSAFLVSLLPLVSLLVALYVFTFGHSHPTHQLSGNYDFNGWSIWYQFWFYALYLHGFSFLILAYSFFVVHSFQQNRQHFYYRLIVLSLLIISSYCLIQNFPDA